MVTTRRRKGASARRPLENRPNSPYSDTSTAGPFTLSRTDPKVSVSAARVDRVGLHVSLTIPLESSLTPRTATNHKQTTNRRQMGEAGVSSSPPSLLHNGRERHKVTLVEQNVDKATQMASQRVSKSTGNQAIPGSTKKNAYPRFRRTPSALPKDECSPGEVPISLVSSGSPALLKAPSRSFRMTSTSPEIFDSSDVDARCSASGSHTGHSKGSKKTQYPSIKMAAPMRLPEGIDTARDLQRLPSSAKQATNNRKLNGLIKFKSVSTQLCSDALEYLKQLICTRRNSSTAGILSASAGMTMASPPAQPSSYSWLNALVDFLSLNWMLWVYHRIFAGLIPSFHTAGTSVIARRAAYALVGTIWVGFLFWKGLVPLNGTLWGGLHRSATPDSAFQQERRGATDAFLLGDASDFQHACSKIGSLCGGREEILCGFPVDSPFNDCVVLGHDVAAKKSGGLINYQQTSGAVSHRALVISQLLENVASFAMPKLGFGSSSTSPFFSTASKIAATKFLQSYYPLYNHNNDPGVLLTGSNATYVIQGKHGQVTIDLARRFPVFAVALEAGATTGPDGRCGSVEVRWFSVYLQLDGREKSACPARTPNGNGPAKGHLADENWCQVGRFEHRCKRKPALQVFCLDIPGGGPRDPPPWVPSGSAACWNGKGWHTQRVRIVFDENWGAGATRIRRLRVLALP